MNKLASVFLVVTVFISTSIFAGGDSAQGQAKSVLCAACHAADGNSVVATFPKLAGQGETYALKQLKDFKSGIRKDATMAGMVATLSDVDMANLAAYYAAQTPTQGVAKKDANITLGEKLYRGGNKDKGVVACIACHGPKGKGIPSAGFPALASQHAIYTVKQLQAFRQVAINAQTDGTAPARTNDNRNMMVELVKHLNNTEIEALAQYVSGLH